MVLDIAGDFWRVQSALKTPTLKLLDRKSASTALPVFLSLFPHNADPIPVESFHTRVDVLINELRASGYDVPEKPDGKTLASQWVKEHWLYRDPGKEGETYRITSYAEQALDYITRATRTNLNISASRIEVMRQVISDAAMSANPDKNKRIQQLKGEIRRLNQEYEQLKGGGELQAISDDEVLEKFANVVREIEGLPADFRRVEEAVRAVHREMNKSFRQDNRPVREVVDEYINKSKHLLESTQEGRAFIGARQLLSREDWLANLRSDLRAIESHPLAKRLLPEDQQRLRGAVSILRRGLALVLDQRRRASVTLSESVRNYDRIRSRELDRILSDINEQLRIWMQHAKTYDRVDVEILPMPLEIQALKLNVFDPDSEKPPEPLEDVSDLIPDPPDLDEVRKQGGPRFEEMAAQIKRQVDAGGLESAAKLFNELPDELKRPVEVFGLLHLLAGMGANINIENRESVHTIRPDGSTRILSMPRVKLNQWEKQGDGDD